MDAALRKRRIEDFLNGLLTWEALVADKPPGTRPESRSPPVAMIPFLSIYHPGNPFATKPQLPGNPPGYRTAYHPGNPFAPKPQKPGNPSVYHPGNPFATKPQQPGNPSSYQTVYQPGNPFVYYKPKPKSMQPYFPPLVFPPLQPTTVPAAASVPQSPVFRRRLQSLRFQSPVFRRRFPTPVFRPRFQSPVFRRRLQSLRFQSPVFRRRLHSPVFRSPVFRSRVFSRQFQFPMFQSPVFRLHPARLRFSPFRLRDPPATHCDARGDARCACVRMGKDAKFGS
ncbi:hypothetical protein EYF80_010801 [Liparis tanakae]|uniref:Uncharacterized protein n=1 Tax=Liparis tanakae TaxID=230148 RepID=A0A4Z2ILZ2_9TELE|nr:hypothetical protein EYF80_010801 [Liparis tanakae]